MATDVVMPQMGESIAEGTIVRWIKKVGDKVDRDEPLFEISTDKVDAEIPSPAAGTVSEIRVKEGETVPVNSVVAVIGSAVTATSAPAASADKDPVAGVSRAAAAEPPAATAKAAEPPKPTPQGDGAPAAAPPPAHYHDRDDHPVPAASAEPSDSRSQSDARNAGAGIQGGARSASTEDAIRERSSPLVRKIAKEHNVDIAQIHGTGIAGRVTKDDILGFIENGSSASAPASSSASARPAGSASAAPSASAPQSGAATARPAGV